MNMSSNYISSSFLSLPNEIIRDIFGYLSTTDLIQSFGDILIERLQNVLQAQLAKMELRVFDTMLEFVTEYFPIVRQYVKRISVDIKLLGDLLQLMPVLDLLSIYFEEDTEFLVGCYITELQRTDNVRIGALTLSTFDGVISSKIAQLLLGGNGRLPEHTLIITSCLLDVDTRFLPLSQLRHVNLLVKEEKILHVLCAHLPHLESMEIAFLSSGLKMRRDLFQNLEVVGISSEIKDSENENNQTVGHPMYEAETETEEIPIVAPAHLRSIIIKGHIATFTRLSHLFILASSSLKTIKMKVTAYSIINPEEIDAFAPHIDFQFNINYQMISMPANFNWQNYLDKFVQHPAVRCEFAALRDRPSVIKQSTFLLTSKNIAVSSPFSPRFPQVEILRFEYCSITMTGETVQFFQQAFPNARILIWRLSQPTVSTKMTLDTINTLIIHSNDRKTLVSLLTLCPNVKQVRFTFPLEDVKNQSELNDTRIRNTCEQIVSIRLVPSDQTTEQEIHKLFPNASVTFDATPYRVRMF